MWITAQKSKLVGKWIASCCCCAVVTPTIHQQLPCIYNIYNKHAKGKAAYGRRCVWVTSEINLQCTVSTSAECTSGEAGRLLRISDKSIKIFCINAVTVYQRFRSSSAPAAAFMPSFWIYVLWSCCCIYYSKLHHFFVGCRRTRMTRLTRITYKQLSEILVILVSSVYVAALCFRFYLLCFAHFSTQSRTALHVADLLSLRA